MPKCAWPAPTRGTGFLPGPPSMIRCLIPSSAKKPLASATMTGANSPLRSQPSWVRTSTWPEAGRVPTTTAPRTRTSASAIHQRRSGMSPSSSVTCEARELAEERGPALPGALTGAVGCRRRGGGERLDHDPGDRGPAPPVDGAQVGDLEVAQPLGGVDDDREDRQAHPVDAREPELRPRGLAH